MTILMIIWLTVLTGYVGLLKRKLFKSETNIKYLLPFIQDKTLKVLTSYIDNDSDELSFDENGDLLEKQKKIESELEPTKISNNLFNKKFELLSEDYKCKHKLQQVIEEVVQEKADREIKKREIVNTEKERLLKDDWIYNKIRESLIYTRYCILFRSRNDYKYSSITCDAINLIPGLRADINLEGELITIYINE